MILSYLYIDSDTILKVLYSLDEDKRIRVYQFTRNKRSSLIKNTLDILLYKYSIIYLNLHSFILFEIIYILIFTFFTIVYFIKNDFIIIFARNSFPLYVINFFALTL